MQIGLIGGIGPAATDYYYRKLIAGYAPLSLDLDLTIVHADTPTLLANLAANNIEEQVEIYHRLTKRLKLSGAGCVVVTSIAGHFCITEFSEISPLPVINMLSEVSDAIKERKLQRVGILGTRTVMETRFYSGIESAEVIPPSGALLDEVHNAYVTMAAKGQVHSEQRSIFDSACEQLLKQEQVEAVMLGGTDLALVYDENSPYPVIDCAVDSILRYTT